MSVILSVSRDDVYDAVRELWEGRGYVWVEPNLIPPSDSVGLWLVQWTTSYELRKLTVKWDRIPLGGVAQDAAMCTFHFLNLTGGVPDATWTTGDYTAVEGGFDTFWTTMKAKYDPYIRLAEYKWQADGPAFRPFGSSLQPTLRLTPKSVLGTGAGQELPPQVAITVTERTASTFTVDDVEGVGTQTRKRWGRFYLPAPIVTYVGNGRVDSGLLTVIGDAVDTFYETCVTAGLHPVMYSPTTGHAWSITEISVDDIYDVIRSRRYVTPTTRVTRAITQPA